MTVDTVVAGNRERNIVNGLTLSEAEFANHPTVCLSPVADAVGDRLEIICDGGIRRGSHVAKALALGATACSIGRPYLYGLAAGGEAGVARALAILRDEFQRTMILSGAAWLDDLTPDMVVERKLLA